MATGAGPIVSAQRGHRTTGWGPEIGQVHCWRFGHGEQQHAAFTDAYGWDATRWPGYQTLAVIRELRMITTSAWGQPVSGLHSSATLHHVLPQSAPPPHPLRGTLQGQPCCR